MMPVPLNKLQGAELLPQEIKNIDEWKKCAPSHQGGYNEAVDDLGMCAIEIDKENIKREIKIAAKKLLIDKNYIDLVESGVFIYISQFLTYRPEKFLKIVRVEG